MHLKHCESQWVSQLVFVNDDGASATALHVDTGECVQLRVHPVEPLVQQVCGGGSGWEGGGVQQVRPEWPLPFTWMEKENLETRESWLM